MTRKKDQTAYSLRIPFSMQERAKAVRVAHSSGMPADPMGLVRPPGVSNILTRALERGMVLLEAEIAGAPTADEAD